MKHWNERGTGLLLCLCIAIPCWMLGRALPVIGGPVFAILAGMAIALLVRDKGRAQAGIAYTSKTILQYAVILLGFGLNLSEVAKVGVQSLPIILSTITTSLVVSFLLHRLLHIPSNISTLVGVGSSVCGGSAIAATAPVIGADDEEIAQSISVIFLFNVAAALLFPTLGGLLGLGNEGFGLFAGTAVNDTKAGCYKHMKRVAVPPVRTVTLFCVSNKRFFLLSYDLGQIDGKRKSGEKPLLLPFLCSTIKPA